VSFISAHFSCAELDLRQPVAYIGAVLHQLGVVAMKCETCAFYQAEKSQCRRNAPVPMTQGNAATAQWPTVAADDWCGEYQAKDATKAA
jgi:hypothetical protein